MKSVKNKLSSILLFLPGILLLTACGSGRNSNTEANAEQFRQMQEMISSRNFEIENDWAVPLSGIRVSLIGNANYIRFKGDSVNVHLPYFGVRHMGGGYGGTNGGIRYEGIAENLTIEENPRRRKLVLRFEGAQGNEDLNFFIEIFASGNAHTRVNTSQRQTISYQGTLRPLDETTQ